MSEIIFDEGRPLLDMRFRMFEDTFRGIRVTGTWLMDQERQAVLVLSNASRQWSDPGCIACCVRQRDAWIWTQEYGDPRAAARTCLNWIASGALPGSASSQRDVIAVYEAVNRRIPDLIGMPPAPIRRREVDGELIVTDQHGKTTETELVYHV